ncbi:hypothetical protein [Desulfomarina sp.]
MIRRKKELIFWAVIMSLMLGFPGLCLSTSTVPEVSGEEVEPAFTSIAEVEHAAALAEQAALDNKGLEDALAAVENAETALEEAVLSGDPGAVNTAEEELTEAKDLYAETLSEVTGLTSENIFSMRDAGMGWGEIAHELGVAPGLLGLGRTRGRQKHTAMSGEHELVAGEIDAEEIAEVTRRDVASGWSAMPHSEGSGMAENPGHSMSGQDIGSHEGSMSSAGGLEGSHENSGHGASGSDTGSSHGSASSGSSSSGHESSNDHGSEGHESSGGHSKS